jgi:hypothetical protein
LEVRKIGIALYFGTEASHMLWLLQTFKGQILRKIFFAPCIAKTLFYSLVKKKYLKSLNDTEISRKTVLD